MAELIPTECGDAILVKYEAPDEHYLFLAETHCNVCRRAAGRKVVEQLVIASGEPRWVPYEAKKAAEQCV